MLYGVSTRTIQRYLSQVEIEFTCTGINSGRGVLLLDTTYFGRNFGVMVIMESGTGRILWRKYVSYERLSDYIDGVKLLEETGYIIEGIVCDGLKGLIPMLSKYPVQMCQFHQAAIGRQALTLRPKLESGIELIAIYKQLSKSSRSDFTIQLECWKNRWDSFLKEQTKDPTTGKSRYIHRRIRSAYFSLIRNMPNLFVFQKQSLANIPNTNNQIEGAFTALKNKLRNHNGMIKENRKRFIDEFFKT